MRRSLLISACLLLAGFRFAAAQNNLQMMGNRQMTGNRDRLGNQIDPATMPGNLNDSTRTEVQSIPPKLYMWHVSDKLGEAVRMPADTLNLNFQSTNLTEGMYGHYNYLGNLGAPRMSRIFFEQDNRAHTIFMNTLTDFYFRPDEAKFTNSNVPYTNLTYYKAGNKVNGEERFKSYFSVNANKRLAFGFNIDYLYGRGYYANQSTAHFNAGVFASYMGNRYRMQAVYNNFYLKTNENGGIADDRYITNPENMAEGKKEYESTTIPVNFEQTTNRNHHFYVYLTHRYRFGFERETIRTEERKTDSRMTTAVRRAPGKNQETTTNDEEAATGDSLTTLPTIPMDTIVTSEFVPVTSLIHTLKVERSRHRFRSLSEKKDFYPDIYLQEGFSNDSTTALSVKNTFGIALLEGFNKYAKAGLTAYVSHQFNRYDLMNLGEEPNNRPVERYTEQEIYVGGELAKRQGKSLHYNVTGEAGILDAAVGQFRINGNMDWNFRLGKDTILLQAKASVSNTLPSFYMRHYHSNHYAWDMDLDKEFRTRIEGELDIERWGTNLRAGVENVKNYTYFGSGIHPLQAEGNIQILSACLRQNFRLGIFHLDNEVIWQKSSNEAVIPLPQLSLYHNFYLLTKVAKKVLTVQLGADVRYFSKYKAPAYAPAIQQFHLQGEDAVEVGGYPFVNVYANLHLKRTRIFVMMYHVNQGMSKREYFMVPHYPINPRLLKIGVSWNFYD